ncbi:MAG TPA: glycine--tRNA ligase [Candidatus Pacearchaeota archaeon]|nr:glycine--tRNA ligase [Candidatus Pacearchaeota archaeon]HQI74323.1 glycine--tRNA ligase [Candidatus Pacearchaeota archaeon]
MENKDLINKIESLLKRRAFVYPSSEIYGGFGSVYDFGPMGCELKNNIKNLWRKNIKGQIIDLDLENHGTDVVEIDSGILMSPKIWEASGHLSAGFADKLVECKKCHKRFKGDDIAKKCPECQGDLSDPKQFNLMMKTFIGPVQDSASEAYLRAETCQGIYVNFKNVLDTWRLKIPFGISQIGKSFRNEITPGNFIFRMREFEQMEMQWFFDPESKKTPDQWFDEWKEKRLNWYIALGIKKENLKIIEIGEEDRAHYAKRQADIMYNFPFGWKEIEGIHNRGDWDLSNHAKHSGQDLQVARDDSKEKYFPHVIETSVGVERSMFAFLCEAYSENQEGEVNFNLHKNLAPVKVAVLPLVKNKEEIVSLAKNIFSDIKTKTDYNVYYDDSGSVGRRYRRQDEIGTPYCITIDYESLNDNKATIRDRISGKQDRVEINKIKEYLDNNLK